MHKRRYMLHPGEVVSSQDSDVHYVGVRQLLQLYGLHPDQVVVCRGCLRGATQSIRVHNCQIHEPGAEELTHLGPRDDGDYHLPAQ